MSSKNDDLETKVQQLLDREAIRDLPKRYCDHVWHNDAIAVGALYCEDGKFIVKTEGRTIEVSGREDVTEFLRKGLIDAPRPYIHNHVVTLHGKDSASGRCYLDLRNGKHNFDWLGAGYYEDQYTKIGGDWYFSCRVFHALRIEQWPGDIDQL